MKLSTKIKKALPYYWEDRAGNCFYPDHKIVVMVDCQRVSVREFVNDIDNVHKELLARGCTLLPKNEWPVVNDREIIVHYTSTNYKEWCNGRQ